MADFDQFKPDHPDDLYVPLDRQFARSILGKSKSIADIKKASHSKTNFRKRGMGDTGFSHHPLTDMERQSILLLKTKGLSDADIALKVKRSTQTVAKVLKDAEVQTLNIGLDWRDVMEKKAIVAVNAGLDAPDDPYKRAGVGVQTLKGLGTFEQEGNMNIGAIIAATPDKFRERYVQIEKPDPHLLEATHAVHPQEWKDDGLRNPEGGSGSEAGN